MVCLSPSTPYLAIGSYIVILAAFVGCFCLSCTASSGCLHSDLYNDSAKWRGGCHFPALQMKRKMLGELM